MTHYDTLGVPPNASASQIAAAYKRKARLVHPDRHQGADAAVIAQAERSMRAINEAWEVLGDPARRHVYDESMRPAAPRPAAAAPPPRRIVPAPPVPSRRPWVVAAAVAAAGVLGWALLFRGDTGGTGRTEPSTVAPAAGVPPRDGAPIVFRDEQAGFTITYPRTWRELTPTAPDMRLSLESTADDGLELRVVPIQAPATQANIASFKAMTDSLVYTGPTVKLQRAQLVTLNGRPTYYYVTTYQDRSGREGIHEQYFIFEGLRMFSLRFQSFPSSDFAAQSAVNAQVADSFAVTRA